MAQYNIKNIKEEFKSKGIFYTQPELAEYMKSLVDVEIKDVYGYMDALGKFEKGQTVPVIITRKGETMTLSLTF